ncbi:cell division protein FtsA [Candidatus Odyssella thessalonicensis]|uniref:cell division protein FtsA n=1 Tax=Candidatus Odyssella thessalonicensis TaxID=84647 RepID=UPI000225BB24|nr:cell division protein FtsA [Candidatus Odyssella thessalonicensis]
MNLFFKKTHKRRKDIFASIDLGSNKICCAIARVDERASGDTLRVIGVGHQHSQGIRNGIITDLEALEDSILNAVHTAEQMAKETLDAVYVSISAATARSHTLDVELALGNGPVDNNHIRQLLVMGRQAFQKEDQQIVHVLPVTYALDSEFGIRDPRGLFGKKLMASLHIVSIANGVMQNITNCIDRCHLGVAGFVVAPYASGLATLDEDELSLGVTVIDLGGSSCGVASFLDGALVHVDSIPIGGAHITNDIARGLSTPLSQAERLKTLYGTTITSSSDERESIIVPQLGESKITATHQVPKSLLVHIVRARAEEMLDLIWKRLQYSGMDRIVGQRIVLTGGTSQLPGIRELASQKWQKQIRVGSPIGFHGGGDFVSTPTFATCGGLLKFAMRDFMSEDHAVLAKPVVGDNLLQRVVGWIRENL